MLGKKAREYEENIARLENELAAHRTKANEMETTLNEYRAKETAIAGALTRAQTDANKILQEAQAEREQILAQAKLESLDAQREAKELIADARRRADGIEGDARRNAKQTAMRAEAFMEEYRQNAAKLIAAMKKAAADAAKNADEFRGYLTSVSLDNEMEMAAEYQGAGQAAEQPVKEMPEEYDNPATLMHSIYAIENRQVPSTEMAVEAICQGMEEEAEADAERYESLDSHEYDAHEQVSEQRTVEGKKPELELSDQEEHPHGPACGHWQELRYHRADGDYQPELEHDHYHGPTAMVKKNEESAAPHPKENPDVIPQEEPKVWTVEEIVEHSPEIEDDSIDQELNAIIEDVLKGT